ADDDVLADAALRADLGALQDVGDVPDRRPGADLAARVDEGGLVGEEGAPGRARRGGGLLAPAGGERLLAALQDGEHPQALGAVGARSGARLHALEEVLALGAERLLGVDGDGL